MIFLLNNVYLKKKIHFFFLKFFKKKKYIYFIIHSFNFINFSNFNFFLNFFNLNKGKLVIYKKIHYFFYFIISSILNIKINYKLKLNFDNTKFLFINEIKSNLLINLFFLNFFYFIYYYLESFCPILNFKLKKKKNSNVILKVNFFFVSKKKRFFFFFLLLNKFLILNSFNNFLYNLIFILIDFFLNFKMSKIYKFKQIMFKKLYNF